MLYITIYQLINLFVNIEKFIAKQIRKIQLLMTQLLDLRQLG